MVAPLIAGAAIGAGASLLGGLFGKKASKDARREEYAAQKEFAQHGVRWRVEDAKAAGLHPLYALGAQTPSYSPSFTTDQGMGPALAEAGQHIGRAVGAQQTAVQRRQEELGLQLLQSQIGETDARRDYYLSEAARAAQAAGQAATFPMMEGGPVTVGELDASDTLRGLTSVTPTETFTRSADRTDTAAGSTPMWRNFELSNGRNIVLPGGMTGDPSEALEALAESPILGVVTLMENERRSPGFMRWFSDEYVPGLKRARHWSAGAMEALADEANRAAVRTTRRSRGHGGPRYRTGGGF